jgi:hypothetical protein
MMDGKMRIWDGKIRIRSNGAKFGFPNIKYKPIDCTEQGHSDI